MYIYYITTLIKHSYKKMSKWNI